MAGGGRSAAVPAKRRACEFCHSTRTPQWRSGPSGSSSLCNACGVKWRRQLAEEAEAAEAVRSECQNSTSHVTATTTELNGCVSRGVQTDPFVRAPDASPMIAWIPIVDNGEPVLSPLLVPPEVQHHKAGGMMAQESGPSAPVSGVLGAAFGKGQGFSLGPSLACASEHDAHAKCHQLGTASAAQLSALVASGCGPGPPQQNGSSHLASGQGASQGLLLRYAASHPERTPVFSHPWLNAPRELTTPTAGQDQHLASRGLPAENWHAIRGSAGQEPSSAGRRPAATGDATNAVHYSRPDAQPGAALPSLGTGGFFLPMTAPPFFQPGRSAKAAAPQDADHGDRSDSASSAHPKRGRARPFSSNENLAQAESFQAATAWYPLELLRARAMASAAHQPPLASHSGPTAYTGSYSRPGTH